MVLGPRLLCQMRKVGRRLVQAARLACPRCRGLCERCPKRTVARWFKKPVRPECRIELGEVSHLRSVHGTKGKCSQVRAEPLTNPSTDVVGQLSLPLISHVASEWPRRSLPSSDSGGASGHGSQDGSRPSPCSAAEPGRRLHKSTALEVVCSAAVREQSKRDGDSIAIPPRAGFQQDSVHRFDEPRRERWFGLPPFKPISGRHIALRSLRPPSGDTCGIGLSCKRYLPTGCRTLQRGEGSEEGTRTRDRDHFGRDRFFCSRDGFPDPAWFSPSPPRRVELLPSCRCFGRLEGVPWGTAGTCDGVPERVREPRDFASRRIFSAALLSLVMEGDLPRLCPHRSCGCRGHSLYLRNVSLEWPPHGREQRHRPPCQGSPGTARNSILLRRDDFHFRWILQCNPELHEHPPEGAEPPRRVSRERGGLCMDCERVLRRHLDGQMVTRSAAHPLAVSCLLRDSGQHICVYLPLRQPPTCHHGTARKRFRHLGDLSLDLHGTLPLSRTRCDHEGPLVRHRLRGSDRRRFGSWLGQRLSLGHVRVAVRIRKSRGSGSRCQWADSLMGESHHAREEERLRV